MNDPMRIVGAPRRFAVLLFCLAAACGGEDNRRERPESVAVIAQTVAMLPEQTRVEAIGTARAAISAQLYPESAGLVRAVRFTAGEYVRAGAPLVELDARRERLALQLAEVAVKEAEQLLGRYRRIEDTGALSASQIEAGETALESAQIERDQAQVALADRTVRAPFSGYMGLPQIDRGDRITPTTLIAQIDDRSSLFVDFSAPESAFGQLRPGAVVQLTPYSAPDKTIDARVRAIDSSVTAEARNFIVRTVIPNRDDAYRPGMSFRANFATPGRARPAVPEAAIVWGGDGAYVWTIRDAKAQRVPLTIAARRDGMVLIDARLRAEERIIVEGVQKVRDGQSVRVVQTQRPATAKVEMRAPANAAATSGSE